MGDRKTKLELEAIMQSSNASKLWSWSRIHSSETDLYGYFLKYIMKVQEDQLGSMYSMMGNVLHDACEDIIVGKITKEEAIEKYRDTMLEYNVMGFTFNRSDEERNDSIDRKYNMSNIHFLDTFDFEELRQGEYKCEDFITIKLSKQTAIGYIDHYMIDGDSVVITDFKGSSIYTGKKVEEEEGQLLLYAEGFRQKGYDVKNIKSRWLFTKYITIDIVQKNGETRSTNCLRVEIGGKLKASVKSWLTDKKLKLGLDESEVEDMLDTLIENNSIEHLPIEVQSKFSFRPCYVYVNVTEEKLNDLVEYGKNRIAELTKLEMEYEKTKDDKLFWNEVTSKNEYFFYNLCGYSRKYHKPLNAYLENKEMFLIEKQNDDIDINDLLSEFDLD